MPILPCSCWLIESMAHRFNYPILHSWTKLNIQLYIYGMRYTKWDRKVIISIITGLKYCQIELLCPMRTSCLLIFTWIVFIMIKSENIFLSKFTIFINQIDSWYHIIEWNVFVFHIFLMSKNLFNFYWCDAMLCIYLK